MEGWKQVKELMSEISEDCYCAGWMMGLEESLWGFIESDEWPVPWGAGQITKDKIIPLKEAVKRTGVWVVWNDNRAMEYSYIRDAYVELPIGATPVPIMDWFVLTKLDKLLQWKLGR